MVVGEIPPVVGEAKMEVRTGIGDVFEMTDVRSRVFDAAVCRSACIPEVRIELTRSQYLEMNELSFLRTQTTNQPARISKHPVRREKPSPLLFLPWNSCQPLQTPFQDRLPLPRQIETPILPSSLGKIYLRPFLSLGGAQALYELLCAEDVRAWV